MADIPPSNPAPTPAPGSPVQSLKTETGAVQPPKKETGKVQPKKETVRINLPPRPTAAPTIKLPTLPPGGPTGASSPAPISAAAAAPALKKAAPAAPAAPAVGQRPAPTAQRPAAAPAIKPLDKVLIYAVAVAGLAAAGASTYLFLVVKKIIDPFQP